MVGSSGYEKEIARLKKVLFSFEVKLASSLNDKVDLVSFVRLLKILANGFIDLNGEIAVTEQLQK